MSTRQDELEAAARSARQRSERAEQDAADAVEKAARARYQLALMEELLFRKAADTLADPDRRAACETAANAAVEESQRRLREWDEIRARRRAPPGEAAGAGESPAGGPREVPPPAGQRDGHQPPEDWYAETDPLAQVRKEALGLDLVGLALSGGGIRSATFGLGVLQGLAQLRLLGTIDFLSTVSGGGYIGSWFAAWVRRERSLINVERQLSPNRVSQARANRYDPTTGAALDDQPRDEEPEPVHHLRAYSRYLSPRAGLFSADTWTLLTIYARNLFVNALFFLPLAFAVVFIWKFLLHGYDADFGRDLQIDNLPLLRFEELKDKPFGWRLPLTALFVLAFAVAGWSVAWAEENLYEADRDRVLRDGYAESPVFTYLLVLVPLLALSLVGGWIFSVDPNGPPDQSLRYFGQRLLKGWLAFPNWALPWGQFAVAFGVLALVPSLLARVYRWVRRCLVVGQWRPFNWRGLLANVVLAFSFGVGLYFVLSTVIWPLSSCLNQADLAPQALCLLHSVGLPLTFGAMIFGGFVEMSLLGRVLSEYEREWRSRLAAWLLMGAVAWLVMAVVVFLMPWGFAQLKGVSGANYKAFLTALWAATSGGGAWLARRGNAPGGSPSRWVQVVMLIAPMIFLTGLFAGVAALGQDLVEWLATSETLADWGLPKTLRPDFFAVAVRWPWINLLLIAAAVLLFSVFGALINVNRFSLHMLYANRLTRCYLGASVRKRGQGSQGAPTGVHEPGGRPSRDRTLWPRQANRFTGFDPLDDFPLSELLVVGGPSAYPGPVQLINCAINCLAGNELAYQDRRADSFVMTADWCGGRLTGYARAPRERRRANNLSLGRVMTVSGAAIDPNMNVLSPPLTALMTLLNTRLGWWLENPDPVRRPWRRRRRAAPWAASEPALATRLVWEFLGQTDESSEYVHISDGGHFENLGVYELIHQRCRFIVVADAGTDRVAASDNMAAMLRLIRTDFGIRVELDPARMQLGGKNGFSAWHCCVGRIRYDEVDERAVPGLLVYLQATLTGDEPPDLLQYVARHPTFPRQSTVNQWFDEAQFEAYRALGHHVATQVFGEAAAAWTGAAPGPAAAQAEVRDLFARLRQQWLEPLDCSSDEWLTAAKAALDLEQHFDVKPHLNNMILTTYPEVGRGQTPAVRGGELPQFQAVNQTLQVMELAWSAMRLTGFYTHPANRGWMNTFRRWTASAAFHRYWPFLRAEYSRPFVSFCEEILNLQATAPVCTPLWLPPVALPADLQVMDVQFGYEWGEQFERLSLPAVGFPRQGLIQDALQRAFTDPQTGLPLAWLISQGPELPCGVACVAVTPRQAVLEPHLVSAAQPTPPGEAEFLVWLRGAYRSMGIGRAAAAEVLQQIDQQSAFWPQRLRYLVAYYPLRNGTGSPGPEAQRWMDLFFDLGFRRHRQPEQGPGAKFIIVKRRVS